MEILIKSALKESDIKYRSEIGERNIELQLFKDFSSENFSIKNALNMIKNNSSNVTIPIVHTPLDTEDIEVDKFIQDKHRNAFIKTCYFANELGLIYNKNILVVVHIADSFSNIHKNAHILDRIDNTILKCLITYPNISIAIENLIPIIFKGNSHYATNGYMNDNVLYVNHFIKNYGFKDRIGTVLDTCHALTSIKLLNYCKHGITMEDFFKWNKDTIRLIHLSNIGDNGYGANNHGTAFTERDIELLQHILDLYFTNNYSCPITIEVFEKDYLNCLNYIETKKNLIKIITK